MTKSKKDTFEKIKSLISDCLCIEASKIHLNSNMQDDLGMDSLDGVELIISVEDAFNIEILDGAAEKLKTVKDLATLVDKLIKDKVSIYDSVNGHAQG